MGCSSLFLILVCLGVVTHSLKLEVIIKAVDEDSDRGIGTRSATGLAAQTKTKCPPQPECSSSRISLPGSNSQGGANSNTGIIGGCVVKPHSLPWQVGIVRADDKSNNNCGGSVICPRYVLSAGHCLYNDKGRYKEDVFLVVVGKHDLDDQNEGTFHEIKKFHEHPKYDRPTYDHDYSIMELKKPIVFNQNVMAIYLPPTDLAGINEGTNFLVSGWGNIDPDQDEDCYAHKLNAVNVPLVSHKACSNAYNPDPVTETMICAGDLKGGKDSCVADSGGPLTWLNPQTNHLEQIGIVSWGSLGACGTPGEPGVYSEVTKGLDWIKSVVGDCNMDTCDLGKCMTGDKLDNSVQHFFRRSVTRSGIVGG